ncbi:MAG: hypothetical protein IJB11_05840 [Oscillospiraceae bacterium]|nr:hypothetical protein [Oscillospiraceae bacterium]
MHTYYDSLSAAITAVNGGAAETVTAENAKAVVITSASQLTKVKLLGDATESASVTVQNDIDLVLNGYTLRFTAPAACLQFGANTRCFIHGAGGSIVKELDTAVTTPVMLVSSDGSSLQIRGGSYMVSADSTGAVLAVRAAATCDLFEMEDCTVEASNATGMAVGAQAQAGNSFIIRTHCTAKATGSARGFMSTGNVKFIGCNLEGTSESQDSNAVQIISGAVSSNACRFAAKAQEHIALTIFIIGGTVTINESHIQADAYNYLAKGIELGAGSLNIDNSSINATAHKGFSASSNGVSTRSGTLLRITNSTVLADSTPNCTGAGNNTGGITNDGTAYLENVKVFGNHCAVQNGYKLYVKGGTYTGFCHGGFYFAHGSEGEAFVNDAILRGGHYEGSFDYSEVNDSIKYSALYLGSSNNSIAHLDGCFLDASDCHRAIVVRGSSGESNNTLNISNCYVTNGLLDEGTIRIDNNTLKMNIGQGCNITSDMFKNYFLTPGPNDTFPQTPADYIEEGVVEYTNALYRKFPN